jgi:hypothetical protein
MVNREETVTLSRFTPGWEDVMAGKLLCVATGAALAASVGVANAAEPVRLTDAQLDRVVAGDASAFATVTNAATLGSGVIGLFDITATSSAAISASFIAVGPAPHFSFVSVSVSPDSPAN